MVLCGTMCCGCELARPDRAGRSGQQASAAEPAFRVDPLPVQQARAYPETATGIFASLADFEDVPDGPRGHEQVRHFTIAPPGPEGRRQFVVNVTRTGVGAMEVTLPVAAELVFAIPHVHDFTGYRLLSMALYSRSLRDDLQVTLVTAGASWRSHRTLIRPGWNNVLFGIRRLADVPGFDISSVREVRIAFVDAAGPVWFVLDDVMVIDNARAIEPTPPGMVLRKVGLDYELTVPSGAGRLDLRQDADGLWRLGSAQAQLRLAGPGEKLAASGEQLALMGPRRVGQVELLEHNAVRLRLANTWYFPKRAGEWASLAVRQVRWEHTFHADGRHVTQGTLNNAGGREIASAGVYLPAPAAWAGRTVADHLVLNDLAGELARWRYLVAPAGPAGQTALANYLRPGRLTASICDKGVFASGDDDRDGFDESQGCYFLAARAGQCRFSIVPPEGGLWSPSFVVAGPWRGRVHVNSEGRAIRPVVRRLDGSALFALPGRSQAPTFVEVAGEVPEEEP